MSVATTGLRERKKLETQRALAAAAQDLARRHGADAVTVEQIAERAGVSPRTFFNYFAGKEAAMVGVEPATLATLQAELTARPAAETPLECLRAVVLGGEDLAEAAARWLQRTELVRHNPSLLPAQLAGMAAAEQALIHALAARLGVEPGDDPSVTVLVTCTLAAARATLTWWDEHGRAESLHRLLAVTFDRLAAGFARPAPVPAAFVGHRC